MNTWKFDQEERLTNDSGKDENGDASDGFCGGRKDALPAV